jgi:hypothetical protein
LLKVLIKCAREYLNIGTLSCSSITIKYKAAIYFETGLYISRAFFIVSPVFSRLLIREAIEDSVSLDSEMVLMRMSSLSRMDMSCLSNSRIAFSISRRFYVPSNASFESSAYLSSTSLFSEPTIIAKSYY